MSKLKLNNVSIKFNNEESEVLHNINLTFISGKTYAILGNSGSGKTTLLNIISNKLENYAGEVLLNGINIKDIKKLDDRIYQNKIVSYIHQQSICFEKLTIKDNLLISNLLDDTNVIPSMHSLNLTNEIDKTINTLSGGEQKRINILQSLNKEYEILLADEPTSNLDNENSQIVMEHLKEESKDKIFIFVTHNKEIANKYADEVLEIKNHHIVKNKVIKLKEEKVDEPKTHHPLFNNKAKRCAKKFVKSEKRNNKLYLASIIILMFAIIIIGSLSLGIKNYFSEQINNTDLLTPITLSTNNSFDEITDDELNSLKEEYPDDNIYYIYNNQDNIVANLNELEIIIPSWSINSPFRYCENLNENELVLTINEEYREYLEYILQTENIEDYMLDNELILEMNINNIDMTYTIKDFIFDEIDGLLIINSSNTSLYESFHNDTESKLLVVEKDTISDELLSFMNSTEKYMFQVYDKYIIFNKTQKYIINYSKLKTQYDNIVPIIENNSNFWINYYNGILYFSNVSLSYNQTSTEDTILFLPYLDKDLSIGREIENDNEIVISSALFNKLHLDSIYNEITLTFNDIETKYTIVGIVDNDDAYIYQNSSWVINEFKKMYPNSMYLYKTTDYIIIDNPKNVQNTVKSLKEQYPEYNVYSYVNETLENIDSIVNIITIIGLITSTVLAFISIISLIIISKIEKDNYEKQIENIRNFGLNNDDLNKIYKKIFVKRGIKSSILIIIISILFIYFINNYLIQENIFNNDIFSYNPLIFVVAIVLSLIIYLISYMIVKFKDQKTPV